MQAIRMFGEGARVGCYLQTMTHGLKPAKKESDPDIPMLELLWKVQPLTLALATGLASEVRRTLFMLTTGDPVQHMKQVGFTLGVPQQDVAIYATPDTGRPSHHLERCDVGKVLLAKADRDSRGWVLFFRLIYAHPSGKLLAYFQEMLNKQAFLGFEPSDGSLDFGEQAVNKEADDAEEQALRAMEGDLATGEFAEARAGAVAGLPLGEPEQERARRPGFRHGDRKARQKAKQARPSKRAGRRSGKSRR